MWDVLPDRVPWYIAGPGIGLLVAGLFAVANAPLGVSGSYLQTFSLIRRRADTEVWRVWYFGGLVAGALVATVLQGGPHLRLGYDTLSTVVSRPLLGLVLFGAGSLMGYGARWAGGCTSGHGLCGTSQRSIASFATMGTFMATAIGVTAVLHVTSGGRL